MARLTVHKGGEGEGHLGIPYIEACLSDLLQKAQNEVQKLLSDSKVTIVVGSLWGQIVGTSLAWSATDGHVSSLSFLVSFVALWFCLPHI